jgi:hypothetical protein
MINLPPHGRFLKKPVLAALSDTPEVLLHGARQCGKSTLARHIAATDHPAQYITLDDAAVLSAVKTDAAYSPASPAMWFWMRSSARPSCSSRSKRRSTASQPEPLSVDGLSQCSSSAEAFRFAGRPHGGSDALAILRGRVGRRAGQFHRRCVRRGAGYARFVRDDTLSRILRGGFPPAVERTDTERRRAWFGSYILTILERDVREIAQIDNLSAVPRALALIAGRVRSQVNFAEVRAAWRFRKPP